MHFIKQDGNVSICGAQDADATAKLLERNGVTGADLGCSSAPGEQEDHHGDVDRLGHGSERYHQYEK